MRRLAAAVLTVCALVALATASAAPAATRAPKLAKIRCVPVAATTCKAGVSVRVGKQVQLSGTRLKLGMRVTVRWTTGAIATKLHRGGSGWVARVPAGVRPGTVAVTTR